MVLTYHKKGKCNICGNIYDKETIKIDSDPKTPAIITSIKCPNCFYNPRILPAILNTLDAEGVILVKDGKYNLDREKASGLIERVLANNWPKLK